MRYWVILFLLVIHPPFITTSSDYFQKPKALPLSDLTEVDLQMIYGIGPRLAHEVKKKGPFISTPGIGPKREEFLKKLILPE